MIYRVGDEIVLKVAEAFGYKDTVPRYVRVLVIGSAEYTDSTEQYLCHVPSYERHPDAEKITRQTLRIYSADPKFLDDQGVIVGSWATVTKHIPQRNGAVCDHCKTFIDYADKDKSGSFTCHACTEDPWR